MSKLAPCACIAFASLDITTSFAPSRSASSFFFAEVVNCTTCAPIACASFRPMCPNPPSPTTPTLLPFPAFQCRSGEYVVIPAHNSGAVAARFRFAGIFSVYASSATIVLEYPPYVGSPFLSSALYVSVIPTSQYCSSPALQLSHLRQESTMQPTPARSPTLNFFTALPTCDTRPTISCPGTIGKIPGNQSLFTWCTSEWQIPQYSIAITTSFGSGSRRSNENGSMCALAVLAA